jgi:hypothetical protein
MHYAAAVRVFERTADVANDHEGIANWKATGSAKLGAQRFTIDVRHREEKRSARFARLEDPRNARMVELFQHLHFTQESVDALVGDAAEQHDFHRQPFIGVVAGREIDGRRCAVSQLAADGVAAWEMQLDGFEKTKASHNYRKAVQTRCAAETPEGLLLIRRLAERAWCNKEATQSVYSLEPAI